jgi:small conductance mechanosensitive channel
MFIVAAMLALLQFAPIAQVQGQLSEPISVQAADATSTQPAQVQITVQQAPAAPAQEHPDLAEIDLIKALRGEKRLTAEQILQLGYWIDFTKDLVYALVIFVPRLFVAVFLFLIFYAIYRTVRKVVLTGMSKAGVDSSIRDMFGSLLKWTILGFGLVIAGNQVGIQIAALLTGVSIIGLAIGFAAQESLQNFIAGIVIFWDKPFKIGDWVEIDDTFGEVQRVTFRSTRILNLDGEVVCYPNTYMLANKLSNHSTNPINRVCIPIGIAYKESIEQARQALLAIPNHDDRVVRYPPPEIVVTECADSSVNLELRVWIADEAIERKLKYEYLEKMKNALDAAGIQIPYPHLQVFVEDTQAVRNLAPQPSPGPALRAS